MTKPLSKRETNTRLAIWAVAVLAVYMSFAGLGNVAFWDDEVETAWLSKAIMETGKPFAWNGRNSHDYGSGLYLNERFENTFPPVMFMVGSLSFRMFGVSESGGRTLFAFLGVICLGVFLLLMRMEIPQNPGLRLAAFSVFSLSHVYLLHARQMRYFAPALLMTVLGFYFYRLYVKKHRGTAFPWSIWAAAACMALLFLTHFLISASFIAALGICHLIFHTNLRKPEWHLWTAAAALAGFCVWYLFSSGYITPDLQVRTNVFSIYYQENWFGRTSSLIPLYLRFINAGGIAPWFVGLWVVWIAAKRAAGKGSEFETTPLIYGAMGFFIVVMCAVFSPQQGYDQYGATRFFFTAFPFFAVATAFFCVKLLIKSRAAGAVLLFLLINTTVLIWPFGVQNSPPLGRPYKFTDLPAPAWKSVNIFSLENAYLQWTLPGMAAEFHSKRETFAEGLKEFFQKYGKQDEVMAVFPTWAYYNALWYLDEKFLFCCIHGRKYAVPEQILKKYGVDIRTNDIPEWFIVFGTAPENSAGRILNFQLKGEMEVGSSVISFGNRPKNKSPQYILVKKLNKLFFPVWRPELFWHSFHPIIPSEDPRRGDVLIFRLLPEKFVPQVSG